MAVGLMYNRYITRLEPCIDQLAEDLENPHTIYRLHSKEEIEGILRARAKEVWPAKELIPPDLSIRPL